MSVEYTDNNKKITKEFVDIESLIENFDEDKTYQLQNTGGANIVCFTVYNGDTLTAQSNILRDIGQYKHKDNCVVYVGCLSNYGTSIAITELGE